MTQDEIDELQFSDEYAEFILKHHDERPIGNGDMLLVAMEQGFLWEEFLKSKGLENASW